MLGYTGIFADSLVASIGIGAGYADLSDTVGNDKVGILGFSPRFRLSLGAAF